MKPRKLKRKKQKRLKKQQEKLGLSGAAAAAAAAAAADAADAADTDDDAGGDYGPGDVEVSWSKPEGWDELVAHRRQLAQAEAKAEAEAEAAAEAEAEAEAGLQGQRAAAGLYRGCIPRAVGEFAAAPAQPALYHRL